MTRTRFLGALSVFLLAGVSVHARPAPAAQQPAAAQGLPSGRAGTTLAAAVRDDMGRLSGRITDRAGTALPGITLVITGPQLAEPRRVVTDAAGRFEVAALPAGRVSVTCSAPGFVQWRREGVEIRKGQPATLNVTMRRPGEVTAAPTLPGGIPRPVPIDRPAPSPPASGGETPAPPPSAHQLLDEIDRYLNQLDPGSIAFNAPERMLAGKAEEIRLLLSPDLTVAALEQQLQGLPGVVQGAVVRIAPRMEASLTGQNFTITSITPSIQAVARNETTEWRWEVSADSAGAHRLHLVLNATIDGTSRTLRTFDRTIVVDVTVGQQISGFVSGNWQWLWATVLVPVAGWVWRRRSTRSARPEASHESGVG